MMCTNASVHAAPASWSAPSPSALARSRSSSSLRTATGEELGPSRLQQALGGPLPIGRELGRPPEVAASSG